jgi:uncharacterized membrane protein (DUF485 family)
MLNINLSAQLNNPQIVYFWRRLSIEIHSLKIIEMLHGPAVELGEDRASGKKSKLGVILFLCYASLYVAFISIGLFWTDLMGVTVVFGLNLAVTYGIGLILLAIVMGVVYSYFCTRIENKMNKEVAS